jgi:hypothetical protein
MNEQDRISYWKTIGLAAAASILTLTLTEMLARALEGSWLAAVIRTIGYIACSGLTLIVASGVLVVLRHRSRSALKPDWFLQANRTRSEESLSGQSARVAPLRSIRRLFGAPKFIVGDLVEVRSLDEIKATLDDAGCLDGLPFMTEMVAWCGKTARVYRSVDKIYDYGGKKDLRRMKDAFLLTGTRCDGSAHGGCQAGCHILWKSAWLRPKGAAANYARPKPAHNGPIAPANVDSETYLCQYTELVAASAPLSGYDVRQDLRPLVAGNMTFAAFLLAIATRLFDAVQEWRGGVGYPRIAAGSGEPLQKHDLDLRVGDKVRVLSSNEITPTLNRRGKNRGLWFDRGMLHYSGESYRVHSRVNRIIDDATGKMLSMKTPSVILEGVAASGELLRFCAQHDYIFWREAWLARADDETRN